MLNENSKAVKISDGFAPTNSIKWDRNKEALNTSAYLLNFMQGAVKVPKFD